MANVNNLHGQSGREKLCYEAKSFKAGIAACIEKLESRIQNPNIETSSFSSSKPLHKRSFSPILPVSSEIPAETDNVDNLPVQDEKIKPGKKRRQATVRAFSFNRLSDLPDNQSEAGSQQSQSTYSKPEGQTNNPKMPVVIRKCRPCIIQ